MSDSKKLESIPLWKMVTGIAEYAESLAPELPEEERWGVGSKLRNRALDVTSNVAEAYGSIDPRDKKWSFGMARRDLFGLKNLLKVAHRRDYTKLDPEIMVTVDKAIQEVDKEIANTSKAIPKWFEEMSPPNTKAKK